MKANYFVMAALLITTAGAAHAKVTIDSDRFTGKTTIMLMPDQPDATGGIDFAVIVNVVPGKPLSSQKALIDLISVHNDWKYLTCHSTHWLADGKKVATPEAMHDGKVGEGYVIEHVMQEVPFSTITRFANSRSIEFEVCNDEGTLSSKDMADLKELVSKVKAALARH